MAATEVCTGEKALSIWGSAPLLESLRERGAIGICGGRDANPEALALAERIGREVAAMGLALVSGNARGVDDAAQFGVLHEGGDLISVLAEGLGSWKPRKHYRPLITDGNYAAVSEFALGERWMVGRAMKRNGTIIEMSLAMVVVSAGTKGGTWEAGRECLRRKKPLLVASGSVATEGGAQLIRNGGRPFDTLEEFRSLVEEIQARDSRLEEASAQRALFSLP